jgi:peptidyl-prolyl cis-trans isomerase D
MLRFLREKGGSWILKGILGFVALTFVSWGGYSMTSGRKAVPGGRVAAWVDEIPISIREFESRYYRQAEAMRQRFGKAYTPELEKQLGLRRITLTQLVSEKLQIKEAERLGIRVLDEEVALRIQEVPAFQRGGQFDPELYRRVLRANRLNPRQFEDQQRLALAADNLRRYIGMGVTVGDNEILAAYNWLNESVHVDYFRLAPSLFSKDVTASDADLKAHYEKNKNKFRVGARRKAAWWYLPFKEVSAKLSLDDRELRIHYEKTRSKYRLQEEVTVQQILIKASPDAKEKIEQAEKKLAEIRDQIVKGKPFEEMAKEHSEGPAASEGGKLGTLKRKEMLPELEKTAFSMKVGEVSRPVRSQFGVHLLKVTKHQRPGILPYEKAKAKVEKSLRESKVREEAKRVLRLARYNAEDKKPLPDIKGLQKGESPFFEKGLPPLMAPERNVFGDLVFGVKKKGGFSSEKMSEEGVLFVRLLDMKESAIPELKEVLERVRASFSLEKGSDIAARRSKEWLQEIRSGKKTFEKLAAELIVNISKPELFPRGAIPEELGRGPELLKKIFSLKKGEVATVSSGSDVIFVQMIERPSLDMSKYKEEKKDLRKRIMAQKKNAIFSRRMEQLQKSANVRLESGFSL